MIHEQNLFIMVKNHGYKVDLQSVIYTDTVRSFSFLLKGQTFYQRRDHVMVL